MARNIAEIHKIYKLSVMVLHVKNYSLDLLSIARSYLSSSNKLSTFYCTQVLNSHKNVIKGHESTISVQFIIENEACTYSLDNFKACWVIIVGVCRSKLPVSHQQRRITVVNYFPGNTTWAWYASQSAMSNICNVLRVVAIRTAFWTVIELGLSVIIVSIYIPLITTSSDCWSI